MSNPFNLEQVSNSFIRQIIKRLSKLDVLEKWYDEWLAKTVKDTRNADDFLSYTVDKLNVHSEVINEELLASVPLTGPFIVVANHPLGGLEGILLAKIFLKIRPDLKVLTNQLLTKIPEFEDLFIGVDVLNKNKTRENTQGMRDVAQHLSYGGALLVFPAGTVSRLNLSTMKISDAPWSPMITRLARKYSAPIMPVFVGGKNKFIFYFSGYIHKRIRTMLLPRAMVNKSGEVISLRVGSIITSSDIKRLSDDMIATSYIRFCCKVLKEISSDNQTDEKILMNNVRQGVKKDVVSQHVDSLAEYLLYSEKQFSLYCVPYDALGGMAEQIAIERERTFRLVDEGTGRELDNDCFDGHYQHLFLWDNEEKQIAGGYRIGVTAEIIKEKGLNGLYSHSLFKYNQKFIEEMGSTIELGRSFVTEKYQRHPKALDILWKGIGRFVAQNPQYHTLFGCVSISRQYSALGSALLTQTFLSHYGVNHKMKKKVKARKPINHVDMPWTDSQIKSLLETPILNKLVGRIDAGKSIPILIRHYLALNGRFVSFTVNEGFNSSLDGLIVVDLRDTKDKYLKRYLGDEGLKIFTKKWKSQTDAA